MRLRTCCNARSCRRSRRFALKDWTTQAIWEAIYIGQRCKIATAYWRAGACHVGTTMARNCCRILKDDALSLEETLDHEQLANAFATSWCICRCSATVNVLETVLPP